MAHASDQRDRQGRSAADIMMAISDMPVGIAVVPAGGRRITCNLELVRALNLGDEYALVEMSTAELAGLLARHSYISSDADIVHARLDAILDNVEEKSPRRQFTTWIQGRKTIIETMGRDGLIWLFVKEQHDAETSRRDEAELTAAVENMAQGLAMFDAHRRLVVCNSEFASMYSIPLELTERGTPYAEIDAWRTARNLNSERLEDFFKVHSRSRFGSETPGDTCFVERENNRLICVTEKPLADGGTVSTHVDITAQVAQDREMARRQAELEQQNMRLDATVDAIPHGLAMFDADHKLVMCNAAFVDINRVDPDLAVPGADREAMIASSRRNGFATRDETENYFAQRAMAIEANEVVHSELDLLDGRHILVGHHPIPDGGWVSFHQDVTELRSKQALAEARTAEAETQSQRLYAAVNNMAHGLAMFDENKKLVVCNKPFIEMYKLPPHLTRPGASFDDLLEHRARTGMIGQGEDLETLKQMVAARVRNREASRDTISMSNGSIVEMLHHPMPDGGWVATHQDITEQKHAEQLIADRSAELEQQNMRFTAAVSNMTHGLSMFDAEHNLVICNQAYADLYGLPEELTRPGTSFWDMLDKSAEIDMVTIADPEQRYDELLGVINAGKPVRGPITMVNGRVMMVQHQPTPDGGWLATHEDITEEHKSAELIEHMARHDPLTDLPNRTAFETELHKAEARMGRGEIMALFCLDLDRFKEVNDTLGHAVGDKVLIEVANRINEVKREDEVAARMGGDEFMLLAGPLDKPHQAAIIAQRLIARLGDPIEIGGHHVNIGASVGIAVTPADGRDGETLMRNADLALYRAKSEGRGTYCYFEQGMDARMQERRKIEQGLKRAVIEDRFSLVYQPLLDLESNRVSGFEALLRWNDEELGNIPPAEFIPIAEETGLIIDIGRWVLQSACQTATQWPDHVNIAVNLSSAQFKDRHMTTMVRNVLETSGLSPGRLELEITESLLMNNAEANLRTLHELRRLGVRIAMDDFGTGYSALSHLRSFPFDKIKIDRSFIADITGDGQDDLVNAVISLGRSLGAQTTAEGVETENQLDLVRQRGCSQVQGFLFSPPLPAQSATELLAVTESRAAALAGFTPTVKKIG